MDDVNNNQKKEEKFRNKNNYDDRLNEVHQMATMILIWRPISGMCKLIFSTHLLWNKHKVYLAQQGLKFFAQLTQSIKISDSSQETCTGFTTK